jgi:hypothetical protein
MDLRRSGHKNAAPEAGVAKASSGKRPRRVRGGLLRMALAAVFIGLFTGCAQDIAAPSRRTAGFTAESEAARSRPGLGTGWGEERDSWVRGVRFVRSSETGPAATERIYYDDREGIRDRLASSGRERRSAGGLQPVGGGLVAFGVRGGSGGWLREYRADGDRLIVGERGQRYELVVRNQTDARLEAVLSVDGLDVLDGRSASLSKRGYIIDPGERLVVDGFRRSSDAVAAFRFSSVAGSYASQRHGETRNVGVIGLAVFTERGREPGRWESQEVDRRRRADPFPGRWAQPPE